MDFGRSARELHDLVRGSHPWPGAYAFLAAERVKIHRAHVLVGDGRHGEPGAVVRADRHGIEIACGQGVLVLDELQPEGRRHMSAEQLCAGTRLRRGSRFTSRVEAP